jgi:hypothetical protein
MKDGLEGHYARVYDMAQKLYRLSMLKVRFRARTREYELFLLKVGNTYTEETLCERKVCGRKIRHEGGNAVFITQII